MNQEQEYTFILSAINQFFFLESTTPKGMEDKGNAPFTHDVWKGHTAGKR